MVRPRPPAAGGAPPFVFGLALIAVGAFAIYALTKNARDVAMVAGGLCLVPLLIMLYIRHTTKCPRCKKVWVGKRLANEDLGASSGVFTRKSGDNYHQYEKHKHRLSYQCTSCGHEWQKIVERDHRLD